LCRVRVGEGTYETSSRKSFSPGCKNNLEQFRKEKNGPHVSLEAFFHCDDFLHDVFCESKKSDFFRKRCERTIFSFVLLCDRAGKKLAERDCSDIFAPGIKKKRGPEPKAKGASGRAFSGLGGVCWVSAGFRAELCTGKNQKSPCTTTKKKRQKRRENRGLALEASLSS